VIDASVGDVERSIRPCLDADGRAESGRDRGHDPGGAVDSPDDAVVAVRDQHGPIGQDVQTVRRAERRVACRPAVAGVPLSADPGERVDAAVRRDDADAVVVLGDVEVASCVEGEIARPAELRGSRQAAVACRAPSPIAGDGRLRAVRLEPVDPRRVGDVQIPARPEVQEQRVIEAAADDGAGQCTQVDLEEARAVQVRDDEVAVLLCDLQTMGPRNSRPRTADVE
jgi:hypothetical protein